MFGEEELGKMIMSGKNCRRGIREEDWEEDWVWEEDLSKIGARNKIGT